MRIALYFLAIFSLSQSGLLARWAAAPAEVLGAWRLLISAAAFLPGAWQSGDLRTIREQPRAVLFSLVASAAFFFAHLWTFVVASQTIPIAHGMIIFATNPLWVSAGAWLFFGERFTMRMGFAYFLAALGLWQLAAPGILAAPVLGAGDAIAFLSALFFAGYILTAKKARQCFSNATYATIVYGLTALLFAVSGVAQGISFTNWGLTTWIAILALVIFPTLLGHALFSSLMNSMKLNRMTLGKLLEPVLATLMARLWFGEPISSQTVLAFLLTGAGVSLLFVPLPSRFLHCRK